MLMSIKWIQDQNMDQDSIQLHELDKIHIEFFELDITHKRLDALHEFQSVYLRTGKKYSKMRYIL